MLRLLGLPLICLAMFSIAGGHWAVLQTVAWAQMVHDYSRTATIAEAISKTFDGQHPCALCCKVKQGREAEDKAPATVKTDKKSEKFLALDLLVAPRPTASKHQYFPHSIVYTLRAEAPPGPVPRLIA